MGRPLTLGGVWLSLVFLLTVACRDTDTQGLRRAGTSTASPVGWPAYAGDAGSQRYSPVADISPGNVATLEPAWRWETGEVEHDAEDTGERVQPGKFETTPLAFGDTLFHDDVERTDTDAAPAQSCGLSNGRRALLRVRRSRPGERR